MNEKNIAISIMIAVCLSACTHPNKSKTVDLESHSTVSVEYPLPETESIDLDKVNFPVIKLTGKHQIVDEGFIDMKGATILKKDNYLIVRNAEKGWENHCYLVYSLPDFRLVKKFAKRGGGPDELGTSGGISTSDSDRLIGHIYDSAFGDYYEISNDFELHRIAQYKDLIFKVLGVGFYADSTAFYLTTAMEKGHFLCRYEASKGYPGEKIYNLQFKPEPTYYYAYTGDYNFNTSKNRIVFAYEFFRQIVILDMDGNLLRVLKGKGGNDSKVANNMSDWMDNFNNKVYYQRVCASNEYVYIYTGNEATLRDAVQGRISTSVIEQYDWNGNPIRRIELDRVCYSQFTVDEKEGKIYLLSTYEDDPLYIYDLPPIHTENENNAEER